MATKQSSHPLQVKPSVEVVAVAPAEQTRRIQAAVARRAYEIFERRGGAGWHELEDWRQAEVLSKLCVGLITRDHTIVVGFDVGGFEAGTLKIWVAPRQLTVCGKPHARGPHAMMARSSPVEHMAFREIQLPAEIDPAGAETNFHGRFLEIRFRQVQAQAAKQASAA